MPSNQINTKTVARIAAVQVIYQYQVALTGADIGTLLERINEFYKDPELKNDYEIGKSKIKVKPSYKHLEELVNFTHQNLPVIDSIIDGSLNQDWQLANLPPLLHAILRVAIAELKFFPEIPHKVIINEYTDIASDMVTSKEVGFINSLLDNYSKNK